MNWLSRIFSRASEETKSEAPILFTNTLTGAKEIFSSFHAGVVSMYSCGPTVYSKQHIGNLKAPLFADLVARVLSQGGYRVRRVINITDVGHLVGDADDGEDKIELGAQREGRSAKEIAEQYTHIFLEDISAIGIDVADISFPRATDYIKEQIAMIQILEERGLTYKTNDGIYFDTSRFPEYGKLGNLGRGESKEAMLASIGRRIRENKEKHHPADFALWKFSPRTTRRQQEWPSPWGMGFPGWHIECSAMIKALLGTQIDIHTGGMDHIPVHHNNEIAQSESAHGKPLARFWLHEAFITVEDEKISKSLGNDVYLSDIVSRGYHPLALRYLFLQAHYRTPISFSWEAVAAANEALVRLWRIVCEIQEDAEGRTRASEESRRMVAMLRDDLATPQALAFLWEVVRDEEMDASVALGVIRAADAVLGLSLTNPPHTGPLAPEDIPSHIQGLLLERDRARLARDFAKADALRIHIENGGYLVEDSPSGTVVTRRPG